MVADKKSSTARAFIFLVVGEEDDDDVEVVFAGKK